MIIQFLECRTFVDLQDLDPALRQISHEASEFLFPGAKVEGRPIIAGASRYFPTEHPPARDVSIAGSFPRAMF